MTTTHERASPLPVPPPPEPGAARTLAAWASALTWDDVPERTRDAVRSQLVSDLAAVRASLRHPVGRSVVAAFGPPVQPDPSRSAQVLAALATALDFDEVAYSGHVSAGAVNVAVAEAPGCRLAGRDLLTTIVAADEVAARITAATILSPFFRGQTNTHCHQASAAVARLHARGAGVDEWTAALGLALGVLTVPLHRGILGGDTKALSVAAPVRMALDACDAAAHGLAGSEHVIEAPDGLLDHLSVVPLREAVTLGLGRRWHTDTLTYKRFPGSAYLHAAFDGALELRDRLGPLDAARVRGAVVHSSMLTWQLERKAAPFLDGTRTSMAAATMSVGYGLACLLATGRFDERDLTPDALADPARWAVAGRVRVEHDFALTLRMIRATSPLGEALRQAGDRALELPEVQVWGGDEAARLIAELGPPQESFAHATMAIGARVELELDDGSVHTVTCEAPVGSAGSATPAEQAGVVRRKFLATGGSERVLADLGRIDRLDAGATAGVLAAALSDPGPAAP